MKTSAGILIYRRRETGLEVLLAHLGGPIWAGKDEAAWTVFKGEIEPGEQPLEAAKREFREETSLEPPTDDYLELPPVQSTNNKTNLIWAVEADYNPARIVCNTFRMEWPPKSGKIGEWPENDRAEWFKLDTARRKLHGNMGVLVDHLEAALASNL